jgi:heavy metal sensor kinase
MKLLRMVRTVRARLTLWNVAVLALVLLILGGVLRVTVERNLIASVDRDITERARWHQSFWSHAPPEDGPGLLVWPRFPGPGTGRGPGPGPFRGPGPGQPWGPGPGPRGPGPPGGPGRRPPPGEEPGRRPPWQTRVSERVFDLTGEPLFPPGTGAPWDRAGFNAALRGRQTYAIIHHDGERVRIVSAPLRRPKRVAAVVQVAYSLGDVERAIRNLNRTLLTLTPVALCAAALCGLFLTGRMLRPVRELTGAAARIGAEDLSRRLAVSGGDEFAELAATFNGMLGRLDLAFEQQRRFTADASHELRTPLTVVKANTSLALSRGDLSGDYLKAMRSIDRAAGVMNRIIQDLLLLARSDAGQLDLHLRPVPLIDVLDAAVGCVPSEGGGPIHNTVESPDLVVSGDSNHLVRLFVNLLENAVRHTPPTGCVTVSVENKGATVVVSVVDTGAGIPPEHLEHVSERFYRVDAARTRAHGGTGLGLAICQSIVQAHGGAMEITSTVGQGTAVRITLPSAASHGAGRGPA